MRAKKAKGKQPEVCLLSDEEAQELIQAFQAQIAFQEDVIYGVALFFEGLNLLYIDQPDVVDTYQKQFRNIIQDGAGVTEQATALLAQAQADREKVPLLRDFTFTPCAGHPYPEEMTKRARILVKTYDEIFPNRPRSQPFTEEEIFRLVESAADRLR